MQDSYISTGRGGTVFSGPDAMRLFDAITLRSGIKLLAKGICPSRGWTMKLALARANDFTGKTYKLTESDKAVADLTIWIETMRAAIPIVED